jgi:D-sedoheptulose 7-phosphate isomerase
MTKVFFENYFEILNKLLEKVDKNNVLNLYDLVLKKSKKGKIFIFGNGANISNSAHFATDMTKNGKINVQVLNDPNLITCFANDYGFDNWIKKTIEYYGNKNDLMIFLSASGESKNLVNAAKYCNKNRIFSASITGFKKNNSLSKYCNLNLWVNSNSYNLIEICQMTILSSLVDKKIGKLNYKSNL